MRKKSHLLLSRYLMSQMEETLPIYKKASFCLGSILPDCMPSFLVKRHSYNINFDLVMKKMDHLTSRDSFGYHSSCACLVNLGQVTHYLADYFTYPHNSCYPGTLMQHCHYERDLKFALRSYIRELEEHSAAIYPVAPMTVEELRARICALHDEYLKEDLDCDCDCHYIAQICLMTFLSMLLLNPGSGRHGKAA